jgi:hypothetical protein
MISTRPGVKWLVAEQRFRIVTRISYECSRAVEALMPNGGYGGVMRWAKRRGGWLCR